MHAIINASIALAVSHTATLVGQARVPAMVDFLLSAAKKLVGVLQEYKVRRGKQHSSTHVRCRSSDEIERSRTDHNT